MKQLLLDLEAASTTDSSRFCTAVEDIFNSSKRALAMNLITHQPLFSIQPMATDIFQGLQRRFPLSCSCTLSSRQATKVTRPTQKLCINHNI